MSLRGQEVKSIHALSILPFPLVTATLEGACWDGTWQEKESMDIQVTRWRGALHNLIRKQPSSSCANPRVHMLWPICQIWPVACFCIVFKLRMFFHIFKWLEVESKWKIIYCDTGNYMKINFTVHKVLLKYECSHSFIFWVWPLLCYSKSWVFVVETIWTIDPKMFIIWPFIQTFWCQWAPHPRPLIQGMGPSHHIVTGWFLRSA